MKKIFIIITGLLLSICTYAQKHIFVAFDVTYSMVSNNKIPVRSVRWEPAIADLASIYEASSPNDYIVIIPFQNDKANKLYVKPIQGYKSALNWQAIEDHLNRCVDKRYNKNQQHTSIKYAWNQYSNIRQSLPTSVDDEFYLITDGDEDHDGSGKVDRDTEKDDIKDIQEYIREFKGRGYYSQLNAHNTLTSESDIYNDLKASDYFKMKIPGTWNVGQDDAIYITYDEIVSGKNTILQFTPIGSVKGAKVDFSGQSNKGISIQSLKFDVKPDCLSFSNTSTSASPNTLSFKLNVKDWTALRCNQSNGYAFRSRIYNDWDSSGKYVIYDKFIDICILRPEPIKATASAPISYTLKNGVLNSSREVTILLKDELLKEEINMQNVSLVNNTDVKIALKQKGIVDGKVTFVLDEDASKFTDGESEFQIVLKHDDDQAFFRYRPIQITVKINSENDKTICFTSSNKDNLKLKYRKGLFARVDTSKAHVIEYTLSDYLISNISTISPQVEFKVESESNALTILDSKNQKINESRIELANGLNYSFTLDQESVRRGDKFNVKVILVNTDGIEQVLYKRRPCGKDENGNFIIKELEIKAKKQLGLFAWLLIGLLGLVGLVVAAFGVKRALAPRFVQNSQFSFKKLDTEDNYVNFEFAPGQFYTTLQTLHLSLASDVYVRFFVLYNSSSGITRKLYSPLNIWWNGKPEYIETYFFDYSSMIDKITITPISRTGRIKVKIEYNNKCPEIRYWDLKGLATVEEPIPNAEKIHMRYSLKTDVNN